MWKTLVRYRPVVSLMAAGLLIGTAVQIYRLDVWVAVLAVIQFWICGLTMVQNDLADRHFDQRKNRTMSMLERHRLQYAAVIQWWSVVALVLIYGLVRYTSEPTLALWQVSILLAQVGVGIWGYSWTRPYYPLNNLVVAVTGASPSLLLLPIAGRQTSMLLGIFVSVGIVLTIRETLKDIQDIEADAGNKQTLPLLCGSFMAFRRTGQLAVLTPWPVAVGLWAVDNWQPYLVLPLCLVAGWGMAQVLGTNRYWWHPDVEEPNYNYAKNLLDVWLLLAVLAWCFHPYPFLNTIWGAVLFFGLSGVVAAWVLTQSRIIYRTW